MTTEYDNIKCGYCDTKYHDSCVKSTETVCRPTYVKVCNPEPLESCSFVKEDKCMQLPIPSCDVTWQKKCTDKLVCSKTFEVTVPTISRVAITGNGWYSYAATSSTPTAIVNNDAQV